MKTVITTVGTSLLTNRKDDRPWKGWTFGNELPYQHEVIDWLKNADLKKASAEIHTWYKIGVFNNPQHHNIILVHSQTEDGKYCAICLKKFIENKKIKSVEIKEVSELNYQGASSFKKGLSKLIKTIAESIRSYKKDGEVVIAATGGFKAQIAVANITGTLLGVPVYYIYEQFEELIKLDPIPIDLSLEWVKVWIGKKFLNLLTTDDCIDKSKVENLLKSDSRLELLIEEEIIDGKSIICLNPLGEIAAQIILTPSIEWPKISSISPEEKNHLQGISHHRPRGYEKIIETISRITFVTGIFFDKKAGKQKCVRVSSDNPLDIFIVIEGKDQSGKDSVLPLRISTTAQSEEQTRMIVDLLKRKIKI